MAWNSSVKADIIKESQLKEGDSGSPEVQVSLLTTRIKYMTEHMKANKKDFANRRGLEAMVSRRRKLLHFLKEKDKSRYLSLVQRLGLRH